MTLLEAIERQDRDALVEMLVDDVVFLCSDYASYVAGVGLPADGGILATMGNAPA